MFKTQSVEAKSLGKPVKIHLVSAGSVAVKSRFRKARFSGLVAMADFIFDRHFTEWMPIWVMVVEHPEGVFIIDTGEIAEINHPSYFKSSGFMANWFDRSQFKFSVSRDEEIDTQLKLLNIPPENVKSVVLTHLHFDHTDGIKYFPTTEILVNREEWEKPFGDLSKLYPEWFSPTLVELNSKFDVFEKVHYLTEAKDLVLVETPGHTWHHCSVLLRMDGINILFAADICYSQKQLLEGAYPGNNASNPLAKKTYDTVKAFARKNKTVFIPSHEAQAAERLQRLQHLPL